MRIATRLAPLSLLIALAACSRPDPLPDLGLSATAVQFEAPAAAGDPAPQSIFLTNGGSGTVDLPSAQVAFQDGSGWLRATVTGSGAPYEIRLAASVGSLAPGSYRATLTVTSPSLSGAPLQAAVVLVVPEPRFALSASTLAFQAPRGGGNPAAQDIRVTNGGRGTLPVPQVAISYVGSGGWLSATVGGTPDGYSLSARADATGLASGTYSATVTFTAVGGSAPPRTLAVSLTVPPAELELSTGSLQVAGPADGTDPVPATIAVTNPGGGLLDRPVVGVTYEGNVPSWLAASVTGVGAPYTLVLAAHQSRQTTALPTGTYRATVTVSAPNAIGQARSVDVILNVPVPAIQVSPAVAEISNPWHCAAPDPTTLAVTNLLGPPRIVGPVPTWLDASLSGSQEPYLLTIRVHDELPFDLDDVLRLDAPGSAAPVAVPIRYRQPQVTSPLTATVTPTSLKLHAALGTGDPASQRIRVATDGGCIALPTFRSGWYSADGWLTTTRTVEPGRRDLVLQVSSAGMVAGQERLGDLFVSPHPSVPDVYVWLDLTAGALAPTSPLPASSMQYMALLALPDGRALAFDRAGWGRYVYDPVAKTWSGQYGSPGPYAAVATLLDGRVLACGGGISQKTSQCSFVLSDGLVPAGKLVFAQSPHSMVALPAERMLVLGPASVEVLDTLTQTSTVTTVPNGARGAGTSVPGGRVLVAGGSRFFPNADAALFHPASGEWTATGRMETPRGNMALVSLPDGRAMAIGGYDWRGQALASAELWDPATGTWSAAPAPANGYDSLGVLRLANGKVLAAGGDQASGVASPDIELFDPATGSWSVVGSLPTTGRANLLLAQLADGMLLITDRTIVDSSVSTLNAYTW